MSSEESLEARFRRRFVTTAHERIERLAEAIEQHDIPHVVRGFHQLAGDAFLLNWDAFGSAARSGEREAIRWRQGQAEAVVACQRALDAMERLLQQGD